MGELERHSKTFEQRRTIGEFLEWCNEKEISLGSYIQPYVDSDSERMAPILKNTQELLDEYFGIEPAQLEKERRELIKSRQEEE